MYAGVTHLSTMEALMIAVSGLAIIFIVMACLCVLITINAKIIGAIEANKPAAPVVAPKAAAPVAAANPQEDEELVAVLMAAIAEETQCDPVSFQITSVVEKKS